VSAGALPTVCDLGRVNGCEKNHRESANVANVGDWAKPNDAVIENGSVSVSEVSVSAGDAEKKRRTHEMTSM
jgi:hypothetical protein